MSYSCRYCDKVLATPGGLEIHEITSHAQPANGGAPSAAGSAGHSAGAEATRDGAEGPLAAWNRATQGAAGDWSPPGAPAEAAMVAEVAPTRRRRLGVIAAAAVVAVAVLAGVFVLTSRSAPSAFAVVTGAPAKTLAARTAQISETLDITPGAAQQSAAQFLQNIQANGVADFSHHQAGLSLTLGGVTIDVVLDGTMIYEKSALFTQLTGGKSWIKLDLNALGQVAGVNGLGNLTQSSYSDPGQGLQYLKGASGPITTLGHEEVRGVNTTHYRLSVSMTAAAASMPPAEQATVRQIIDQFGVASMPVDVWIDHTGVVRRVHESFDYSNGKPLPNLPAGSMPKGVDITVEYYGFGTAVTNQVPPADQVADVSQALGQLGNRQGGAPANPLEGRLLQSVPPGYSQQPDRVGDTGPSDLAKAARDDGSSNARQVLVSDGFVAGYQRLWAKDSNAQIIDYVYQFSRPQGALSYMARTEGQAAGVGARSFAVSGVPGAYGFVVATSEGSAVVVFMTRGGYLAQVVIHGPDATSALLTQLAQEQYQLLG